MGGCFIEADMWENVLLRTDTWCFSGGSQEKGHVMFWVLERTQDV